MSKTSSKPRLVIGAITLGIFAVAGLAWLQSIRPHELEIYVIDVPGTPAIFIRTPNDRRILVNGGSNAEIIRHLTAVLPFYSKRLDMILAAEPNGKAVSGLIDVLDRYSIDRVGITANPAGRSNDATTSDAIYGTFLETVDRQKLNKEELFAGDKLFLDEKVEIEVIFPVPAGKFQYSKASAPENVLRIRYGEISFLLAGHSSLKIQKFISNGIKSIKNTSNVLIIFNSATDSNLSGELMTSMRPDYLVYKAAKEPQKANTKNIAGILLEDRFNIHETGKVKIVSNGTTLKINKI